MSDRGIRNNNPGNIEYQAKVKWQGLDPDRPSDGRFCRFLEPAWGVRAVARTLITYQDSREARDGSKIDTITDVVERWAPAVENDVEAYVQHLDELSPKSKLDTLNLHDYADVAPVVEGIIAHENSGHRYPKSVLDEGLRRAGILPPPPSLVKDPKVVLTTIGAGSAVAAQVATNVSDVWSKLADIHPLVPHVLVISLTAVGGIALLLFLVERLLARRRGVA